MRLHNNEMACYLMLARHCGIYNNRQLVAEVQRRFLFLTLTLTRLTLCSWIVHSRLRSEISKIIEIFLFFFVFNSFLLKISSHLTPV